jgi:hypothetical protein
MRPITCADVTQARNKSETPGWASEGKKQNKNAKTDNKQYTRLSLARQGGAA